MTLNIPYDSGIHIGLTTTSGYQEVPSGYLRWGTYWGLKMKPNGQGSRIQNLVLVTEALLTSSFNQRSHEGFHQKQILA